MSRKCQISGKGPMSGNTRSHALNASRRKRIANGSGTSVQEINRFMTSFETTQKMMKKIKSGKGMRNMMKNLNMNDLKDFKM